MPELWVSEDDRDWELHARGEGWLDEFAPADVADDRPDFRNPLSNLRVTHPDAGRRGTYEQLRELKVKEGLCPLPGCGGKLDQDWFCSQCGFVSTPGAQAVRGEKRDEREAA